HFLYFFHALARSQELPNNLLQHLRRIAHRICSRLQRQLWRHVVLDEGAASALGRNQALSFQVLVGLANGLEIDRELLREAVYCREPLPMLYRPRRNRILDQILQLQVQRHLALLVDDPFHLGEMPPVPWDSPRLRAGRCRGEPFLAANIYIYIYNINQRFLSTIPGGRKLLIRLFRIYVSGTHHSALAL